MPLASASNRVGNRCGRSPAQRRASSANPRSRRARCQKGARSTSSENSRVTNAFIAGRSSARAGVASKVSLVACCFPLRSAAPRERTTARLQVPSSSTRSMRLRGERRRTRAVNAKSSGGGGVNDVCKERSMSHQALRAVNELEPRSHREAPDARRRIGARIFDFSREVAVMAIVNRTPDSFFDQGATFAFDKALDAAKAAVRDGADIVDVGGVPFGHGPAVSLDEEIARVVPLIEAIREICGVAISVDTHVAEVARRSIAAGANVVNDTSGLRDPEMAGTLAGTDAMLVLTHSAAPPRSAPSAAR